MSVHFSRVEFRADANSDNLCVANPFLGVEVDQAVAQGGPARYTSEKHISPTVDEGWKTRVSGHRGSMRGVITTRFGPILQEAG